MSAEYMTTDEVADYTGIPVGTVEKLRAARQIPVAQVGRRFIYPRAAIDQWLAAKVQWPADTPRRAA